MVKLMFTLYDDLTKEKSLENFTNRCDQCDENGDSEFCKDVDDALMDAMLDILWQMCTIGGAMWFGQYLFSFALNTSAMRQIMRMRKEFLMGTLRQEVGWYDTNTTGDFATKMTEDLNKIQDGIGEKLGMIVRFVVKNVDNQIFR